MQDVHQLSLIFMETLYLHIEDGPGIHVDAVVLLDVFCQADLVLILDVHELSLALLIVCVNGQLFNMGQVCDPLVSDLIGHPAG